MATYGYVRVSTKEQKTDRQMEAMQKYGVDAKYIFVDKVSGKDFNRPSYQKLVKKLRPGDLLVIKSIDRLGRDYKEILEEWRKLVRKKEIDIMRLVGTSNTVIRLPFLFEGLFLGLIGSIIPILCTIYGYVFFYEKMNGVVFTDIITLIKPYNFVFKVSFILLIIGGIVGMFGSYKAVRKYLKI